MDLKLEGRRCLVTGASAGIGAAIVKVLAREGAYVVATARRQELLQAVADSVHGAGNRRPAVIAGDITDKNEVLRIASAASEPFGPIEILVNCAGYSMPVDIDAADEIWDDAYDLNFTAVRRISTALLPDMRQAGFGRIVNLTSVMEPMILNATSLAKAAVHVWAKGLSRQIAAEGVTVNCIAPGLVRTDFARALWENPETLKRSTAGAPLRRIGEPDEIAGAAIYLASKASSFMTGQTLVLDGGVTIG